MLLECKLGAIDILERDEVFEPAECGGFLLNGGRLYVDAVGSHLEYATAECRTLQDLIANDRAGQRLIVQGLDELGLRDAVSFYNNSVDHFGGHTFGCHENYLVRMEEDFYARRVEFLIPFLVTRQIFAGVGRVGGHQLFRGDGRLQSGDAGANPIDYIWVSQVYHVVEDPEVQFQLSQRADHILKTVASRVRFNRALINPRWEHFYAYERMQRFHLLFGESNQMEYAYALKVGTTLLVLRLLENDWTDPSQLLADPLMALREISRDPSFEWRITTLEGTETTAIEVQRKYLSMAQAFKGESEQTDWVLREWQATLDGLARDPFELKDRIDWVAKYSILQDYMAMESIGWEHDSLHSIDLEYHNIDPQRSLYHGLVEMGQVRRFLDDLDIVEAMTEPPQNTRAKGRADLVREILRRKKTRYYVCDWNGVALDRETFVELNDPFETYSIETGSINDA